MEEINNHKFYKKSYAQYGISARGVHWNSKYTQYKRFEILTSFIKSNISSFTIVDAGCGFAEYYNYLRKNELLPKEYIGIDCEEHMIEVSKKRFSNINFYKTDILKAKLPKKEYYICSGALNLLNLEDLTTFITNCFSSSEKGFIFNYLQNENFVDISKDEILRICKVLSSKIKLRDGYLHNDYTIFLEK